MAFQFHLPDIGEGVVEGEIVSWKVAQGDRIELDQPLVEVMTDKATVEIPSPRAGVVSEIRFQEGEICPVGDVLVVIDDGSEDRAPGGHGAGHGAAHGAAHGATATKAEAAADADSTTQLAHGLPAQTQPAQTQPAQTQPVQTQPAQPQGHGGAAPRRTGRVLATPATRRLARKLDVDLALVPGTGRRGRVTSDDVRQFAQAGGDGGQARSQAQAGAPRFEGAPVSIPRTDREERIPLRGMRKRIADNMARSVFTAAHFTYVEEVDMTELVDVRARARSRADGHGVKLTYLPFIVKAIVTGLKKWPQLNASLDETTQEIVRKKYYHIGIAAQGPSGLVVTVVRDADTRSIMDIAREIQRLADAVRDGTASRDDLTGSTFTITSLGKLGGVLATPIINFPEVGIVGVHEMKERPAVRNHELCVRWLMNLSISLDHRLVDGWDGAMFLQDVKALLEDPTAMFMEMV